MDALLNRLSLQTDLQESDFADLKRLPYQLLAFQAGEEVVSAGQLVSRAFVVETGWGVRTRTLSDGRRQIVNFMVPGDCFDLQAVLAARSDHAVSSLTPMRLRAVPAMSFVGAVRQNAALAAAFWWIGLQEESILREHIVRLGKRGARERLAHLLLELRRRQLIGGLDEATARQAPLTREVLADALGLSVVHVSRVVTQFVKSGLLIVRHRLLQIDNVDALAAIAQFNTAYLHQDGVQPLPQVEALQESG
jgi:CRP-like cAMP-binding protein